MSNLRGLLCISKYIELSALVRELSGVKKGWMKGLIKVCSGSLSLLKERKTV